MSGAMAVGVLVGFAIGLLFVGVNISVAYEIAVTKHRSGTAWGLFSFLFPVVGPFLVYLLPARPKQGP